jgi:hypothetical protein
VTTGVRAVGRWIEVRTTASAFCYHLGRDLGWPDRAGSGVVRERVRRGQIDTRGLCGPDTKRKVLVSDLLVNWSVRDRGNTDGHHRSSRLCKGMSVMAKTNNPRASEWSTLLMNIGVVAFIAALSTAGMIGLVNHLRPRVGDIISFERSTSASSDVDPRIDVVSAATSSAISCVLDVHTMRLSGGSLVIEAMRYVPVITYRAHWAGGPTSNGPDNCGATAELMLGERDIAILKMAGEHWAGKVLPATPEARSGSSQ